MEGHPLNTASQGFGGGFRRGHEMIIQGVKILLPAWRSNAVFYSFTSVASSITMDATGEGFYSGHTRPNGGFGHGYPGKIGFSMQILPARVFHV
jgi:hypothetical protein